MRSAPKSNIPSSLSDETTWRKGAQRKAGTRPTSGSHQMAPDATGHDNGIRAGPSLAQGVSAIFIRGGMNPAIDAESHKCVSKTERWAITAAIGDDGTREPGVKPRSLRGRVRTAVSVT